MDKEKVIKGLEGIIDYFFDVYRNDTDSYKCEKAQEYSDVAIDAIAMLKKQEAKTGTWQWKIHGKAESGGTLGEAICDQCGKSTYATAVKGDLNYCPNCGAKMT